MRKTEFISVEVAIKTEFNSDAFVKWFEDRDEVVSRMEDETHRWYIYFAPTPEEDANTTIVKLCEMIRDLPPKVRLEWDQAAHREFYAGYHVGEDPFCVTEHLGPNTLEAVVEVNAGIGYAFHPAGSDEEQSDPSSP